MKAAFLAVLTLRIAFWLERVSRRFTAVIPHAPAAKFDLVATRHELSLEQTIYAARKSPRDYEFMREDGYFRHVKRLLDQATNSKTA
jgi:hypothetical protein